MSSRVEMGGVLCPKCNGQGHVNVPPWVPGDQPYWFSSTTSSYRCRMCCGSGLIFPAGGRVGGTEP